MHTEYLLKKDLYSDLEHVKLRETESAVNKYSLLFLLFKIILTVLGFYFPVTQVSCHSR